MYSGRPPQTNIWDLLLYNLPSEQKEQFRVDWIKIIQAYEDVLFDDARAIKGEFLDFKNIKPKPGYYLAYAYQHGEQLVTFFQIDSFGDLAIKKQKCIKEGNWPRKFMLEVSLMLTPDKTIQRYRLGQLVVRKTNQRTHQLANQTQSKKTSLKTLLIRYGFDSNKEEKSLLTEQIDFLGCSHDRDSLSQFRSQLASSIGITPKLLPLVKVEWELTTFYWEH